jgi:hypothetical protein
MSEIEAKVFAVAINEIRSLLGGIAGDDAPYDVKFAWRLAYALHNDAWAMIEGGKVDLDASLARIEKIDQSLGGDDGQRIAAQIRDMLSGGSA